MKVNVFMPVYNSPSLAMSAINAIINSKNRTDYELNILDDGSDSFTHNLLLDFSNRNAGVRLRRSDHNCGFIATMNRALIQCNTKYAVIINSDVIVTNGWLDNLVASAESDETIASVNPLTNSAAHISIDMPAGVNVYELNEYTNRCFTDNIDVVTGVGFCMLLRTKALRRIGYFDEVFGFGYCEDSDLCMRFTTAGWRTVVSPKVFVYHKGQGSFENKQSRIAKNRAIFDERWNVEYKQQYSEFIRNNNISKLKKKICPNERVSPVLQLRRHFRHIRYGYKHKKIVKAIENVLKNIYDFPVYKVQKIDEKQLIKFKNRDRISITYIIPKIALTGGVISVLQLVNELIHIGIDARIATIEVHEEMRSWSLHSAPMIFKNFKEMIDRLPTTDIAIATHWTTASVVKKIVENSKARESIYFVQDFEPFFHMSKRKKNECEETYSLIQSKIVKSEWLKGKMLSYGGKITKIPLGMDLRVFYPRWERKGIDNSAPVILAMARPSVPHRGFNTLIASLSKLKRNRPLLKIKLFGERINANTIPFKFEGLGILLDRNAISKAYSEATIYIDASDFQGFGRPALEAMACGTACVLTNKGGVNEYAVNRKNALLVNPNDSDSISSAVSELIDNEPLYNSIVNEGLNTAKSYCHKLEAEKTKELICRIITDKNSICYN